MRYFLLTYCTYDGGHEHFSYITTKASDIDDAIKRAVTQEHDELSDSADPPSTLFGFGDGETICRLKATEEITREEVETLDKLGVAYYYELNGN